MTSRFFVIRYQFTPSSGISASKSRKPAAPLSHSRPSAVSIPNTSLSQGAFAARRDLSQSSKVKAGTPLLKVSLTRNRSAIQLNICIE